MYLCSGHHGCNWGGGGALGSGVTYFTLGLRPCIISSFLWQIYLHPPLKFTQLRPWWQIHLSLYPSLILFTWSTGALDPRLDRVHILLTLYAIHLSIYLSNYLFIYLSYLIVCCLPGELVPETLGSSRNNKIKIHSLKNLKITIESIWFHHFINQTFYVSLCLSFYLPNSSYWSFVQSNYLQGVH